MKFITLCLGSTKTEFAQKAGIDKTLLFSIFVMSPDKVAKVEYKALIKGKLSVIVDLFNKMQILSSKILQYCMLLPIFKLIYKGGNASIFECT